MGASVIALREEPISFVFFPLQQIISLLQMAFLTSLKMNGEETTGSSLIFYIQGTLWVGRGRSVGGPEFEHSELERGSAEEEPSL